MLDKPAVLAKTDRGREAIARRTHNLNPRQRALLISINGETSVGGLLSRFGVGDVEAAASMIETLLAEGLVAVVRAPLELSSPGPALATGVDRPAASTAPVEAPRGRTGDSTETPSFFRPDADQWRLLQQKASDRLQDVMGSDADLLNMRLLRSRNEAEFLGHLDRAIALIDDARGALVADAFRRSLVEEPSEAEVGSG